MIRLVALGAFQVSPLYEVPESSRHDRAIYAAAAEAASNGAFLPDGALEYLPLYPWTLGVIGMLFGTGPLTAAVLGIVCDVLTTLLIVLFARRLGATWMVAGIAGLLYAAYPLAVVYSLIGMPNTLNTMGVTAFAFASHHLIRGRARRPAEPGRNSAARRDASPYLPFLLLGLLAGVVSLGFAGMILIALVVVAMAAWKARAWLPPALLLMGLVLPIAPVSIHNSRAEGSFVALTTHGGLNFYMGNHERATGYPLKILNFRMTAKEMLEDAHAHAEQSAGDRMTHAESSAWWKDRANAFWREHPGSALQITLKKLALFWNHREMDDLRMREQLAVTTPFFRHLAGTPFAVFGVLGLIGLFYTRHAKIPRAVLLAGMIGIVMFFITARYRLTFVPLMAVLGAGGCTGLHGQVKSKKWWCAVLFILLAALFVLMPFDVRDQRPVDYYNAATQMISRGEHDKALELVEQGLDIDPNFGPLYLSYGSILYHREAFADAAEVFRTARRLIPENPTVHFNLALSLARLGDYCAARDVLAGVEKQLDATQQDLLRQLRAACP